MTPDLSDILSDNNSDTQENSKSFEELKAYCTQLEVLLEEKMRHLERSERQAVIAQNIQGIIHNQKTPLGVISMNTQMILMTSRKVKGKSKDIQKEIVQLRSVVKTVIKYVETIDKAVNTINDMITSLLTKSQLNKNEDLRIIDLNSLVNTELKFFESNPFYKNHVEKNVRLYHDSLPVSCVPAELSQTIENIIQNSLDAMHKTKNPRLFILTDVKEENILISISDNGVGIPDPNKEKIFDPFFTTKPANFDIDAGIDEPKGTGIGMWMVYRAIKKMNGSIFVADNLGGGTTVEILLPSKERRKKNRQELF